MRIKLLTFILMIAAVLTLGSCGFVVEEEGLLIDDITAEVVKEGEYKGQTKVTITYVNNVEDPKVFYIPNGATGVGIDDIQPTDGKEGFTAFQITLTTGETEIIEVPNGVSIVDASMTPEPDEQGKYYMIITFSDGTKKEVETQTGPAGKDGYSIVDVINKGMVTEGEFMGKYEVIFVFSDGADRKEEKPVYMDPGVGISNVSGITKDNKYQITVTYTDGSKSQPIEFDIPTVQQWHTGTDEVPNEDLGNNGDFYFDTKRGYIHKKVNGNWEKLCQVNLEAQNEKVDITFDLNANDDKTAKFDNDKLFDISNLDGTKSIRIQKNYNLASLERELPTASRKGYVFAGWYSVRVPKDYINSMFTDFTTVPANIT